jgi:hypothetical protein
MPYKIELDLGPSDPRVTEGPGEIEEPKNDV